MLDNGEVLAVIRIAEHKRDEVEAQRSSMAEASRDVGAWFNRAATELRTHGYRKCCGAR